MAKWKEMLSYKTMKMAKIDNVKLGIMHYTFEFIIVVYIVVYKVVCQVGYIEQETPLGSVRLSLQEPNPAGKAPGGGTYSPDYPNYSPTLKPFSELPYCTANSSEAAPFCGQPGYPCMCKQADATDIVNPVSASSPFYIATQITSASQHLNSACDDMGNCDKLWEFDTQPGTTLEECRSRCPQNKLYGGCNQSANCWQQQRFYVPQIENFTLMIAHSVLAPSFPNVAGNSNTMAGKLRTCGNTLDSSLNKSTTGFDIFTLETLLDAATFPDKKNCGVKLDAESFANPKYSVRYEGMILLISITYQNFLPWTGLGNISYTYDVSVIKGAESKVEMAYYNGTNLGQRVVRDEHGIKIVVLQTGSLGQFDATTLIILLTASLGLLKLSSTMVDYVMIYFLEKREFYKSEKYVDCDESKQGSMMANVASGIYAGDIDGVY